MPETRDCNPAAFVDSLSDLVVVVARIGLRVALGGRWRQIRRITRFHWTWVSAGSSTRSG